MTLYNNFLLKRGVGLFSRVGLISGDYGTTFVALFSFNSTNVYAISLCIPTCLYIAILYIYTCIYGEGKPPKF